MFRLKPAGPERGDCTAPYEVVFDRRCTLREFCASVLKNEKDWGYVLIRDDRPWSAKKQKFEYRYGAMLDPVPEDLLGRKIDGATAEGGWSRMDYFVLLERRAESKTAAAIEPEHAVYRTVGINPAHLSDTTVGLLREHAASDGTNLPFPVHALTSIGKCRGYMFPVNMEVLSDGNVPEDLMRVVRFAVSANCPYVRIDPLFAETPELPVFGKTGKENENA